MKPRAVRRHHERRTKRRVEGYYGGVCRRDERRVGRLAQTRTPRPCFMCGNPRKFEGRLTVRGRRAWQGGQGGVGL